MKRTFFVLLLPFFLSSCAQLFDSNLYSGIDKAAPVDPSVFKTASVEDIQSMIDDNFLEQLQDDPQLLEAAQDALDSVLNDPDATAADALAAGATLIELTTGGSGVAELTDNGSNNVATLADEISAGHYTAALKIFMGDKTQAEIKATLDNLSIMATTLSTMQTLSQNTTGTPGTINSSLFFSGTAEDKQSDFAISAYMAAVAKAQIEDSSGSTALALNLANPPVTEIDSTGNDDMGKLKEAIDANPTTYTITLGTATAGSNYSYAYVAILQEKLPL